MIARRREEEGRLRSASVRGKKERRRRGLARRGKAGRTRDERDARDHSPVNCLPPRCVPSSVMLLLLCSVLLLLLLLLRALLLFPPPPLFSFTVAHRQCHRLAHVVVPTKTSSTILHLTRHSAPVKQLNIIPFKKTAIVGLRRNRWNVTKIIYSFIRIRIGPGLVFTFDARDNASSMATLRDHRD